MSTEAYARVIDEWSSQAGMTPWATDAEISLQIEDAVVSLIHEPLYSPQVLHIFIDLGPFVIPGLHERLLLLNMSIGWPDNGYFALQPETGRLTYRVSLPLTPDIDGRQMQEKIAGMVFAARTRLQL